MKTIGKIGGRKPNGRGEEREPLGGMWEGAPTEVAIDENNWEDWGWKIQWKHWEKETVG